MVRHSETDKVSVTNKGKNKSSEHCNKCKTVSRI